MQKLFQDRPFVSTWTKIFIRFSKHCLHATGLRGQPIHQTVSHLEERRLFSEPASSSARYLLRCSRLGAAYTWNQVQMPHFERYSMALQLMWKERSLVHLGFPFHLRIYCSCSVGKTARQERASLCPLRCFRLMACSERGSEAPAFVAVVGSVILAEAVRCWRRCRHCWDKVVAIARCRLMGRTSGRLPLGSTATATAATAAVEAIIAAIARVRRPLPRRPGAAHPECSSGQ